MRRAAILVATVLVLAACGDVASDDVASTTVAPASETPATSAGAEAPATTTAPDATTTTTLVPTEDSASTTPVEKTTSTTQGDAVTGKVPADLLASIVADAVARTGAGESDFTVVRARPATWNDGSLGCPEPGMSYTQALVNGFWVVLEYGGVEFDYRASSVSDFRLCIGGGSPPSDANI